MMWTAKGEKSPAYLTLNLPCWILLDPMFQEFSNSGPRPSVRNSLQNNPGPVCWCVGGGGGGGVRARAGAHLFIIYIVTYI